MIQTNFKEVINKIFTGNIPDKIAVAVSGGCDSMALVFLLNSIENINLTALIVDHKSRADSSKDSAATAQILKHHKINYKIVESYLKEAPQTNIEASLREVRYNLLNKYAKENNIKYLFVGHHMQDQAENFLIRLFRGSGIDGLAATDYITQFQDIHIVRPLLDFKKEDLQEYLTKNNIEWVEDESNKEEKYLRNKIRNFLNSLEDKDLINQRITLASKSILESKKIIESDLIANSKTILQFYDHGYILLNINNFSKLAEEKAKRYLAWSLMEISGNHYKPRLKYLENLYFNILKDSSYKKSCFYGCIIEKYNDKEIIIYREKSKIRETQLKEESFIWDNRFKINYKDFDKKISVSNIEASEFNKLEISHNMSGLLKNIIYTLPVIKKDNEVIAIPHLNYYIDNNLKNRINITFDKKTKL